MDQYSTDHSDPYYQSIIVKTALPCRLDRYLFIYFPHLTQGIIQKALRKKDITLNKEKTRSNARVIEGDIISIHKKFANINSDSNAAKSNSDPDNIDHPHKNNKHDNHEKLFSDNIKSLAKKLLSEYLILKRDEFIAIDKPPKIATQQGSKVSISIDAALKYLNITQNTDYKLVHRLDKNTSGILILANGRDNAAKLANGFHEKIIHKKYIAIVAGIPNRKSGILTNYIGKITSPDNRKQIVAILDQDSQDNGKFAKTTYKLLSTDRKYSLIEFIPETGRMHQIRVQASKNLGLPILGDVKYGGIKHQYMMLHALNMTIDQSIFGETIHIESKFPQRFGSFITCTQDH